MRSGKGCEKAVRLIAVLLSASLVTAVFYGIADGLSVLERLFYPARYGETVRRSASFFGVPESVVFAVIRTESRFDETAVSRAGACGLMQLMPETYKKAAGEIGRDGEDIFDPAENIACGSYWLARLYRKYRNWETVYAAYNAGEAAVDRWLADPATAENGALTRIPYPETAAYVRRVIKAESAYRRQLEKNYQ